VLTYLSSSPCVYFWWKSASVSILNHMLLIQQRAALACSFSWCHACIYCTYNYAFIFTASIFCHHGIRCCYILWSILFSEMFVCCNWNITSTQMCYCLTTVHTGGSLFMRLFIIYHFYHVLIFWWHRLCYSISHVLRKHQCLWLNVQ